MRAVGKRGELLLFVVLPLLLVIAWLVLIARTSASLGR